MITTPLETRPVARMRRTLLRGGLGVTISVVSLALVAGMVDLASVATELRSANPWFVAAAVGATCLDLTCRTFRWQGLLAPIRRVAFLPTLGYLLIGYFANNLLPARLGELVRSHYMGGREGFSRATALGTIVVERIVDIAVLVGLASVAILLLGVGGILASAVLVGLGVTGLLIVGLALALAMHRLPFAGRLVKWVERWPMVLSVAGRLRGGLAIAGRPRTVVPTIAWSILAWAATAVGFAAAGQAVGVQLKWSETLLLSAGVALSTAIPAGPGYVGTFELAGVQIAGILGVPPAAGLAMTLVAHASGILVTSVGGAVALLRLGWGRKPLEEAARNRQGGGRS